MNLTQKFKKLKKEGKKWTVVTSYDYWSANILNGTDVDALLVGDCAAMVMHGHDNTLGANEEMLLTHTRAVAKGAPDKFIITSLPFMTGRRSVAEGLETVARFVQAGAHAVKIEGGYGNEEFISAIVGSGIPVIGHIGLKPTHINMLTGFKVQGKTLESSRKIVEEGKLLEELGCSVVVLEAVRPHVGAEVAGSLEVPVVGIGAGPDVDGQGLVFQDMLGLTTDFKPKFVRTYVEGAKLVTSCINNFVGDVHNQSYPDVSEMYLPKTKVHSTETEVQVRVA